MLGTSDLLVRVLVEKLLCGKESDKDQEVFAITSTVSQSESKVLTR